MSALTCRVDRHQGAFSLSVDFEAPFGICALFGRSGAGKSSVIKLIAGLTRPDRGRIVFGQATLADVERRVFVPPRRRRIGVVFQEPRLFPHLNAQQNLQYGLWLTPRGERRIQQTQVVELLGIGPILKRRPEQLSGGERQRVAIGRALLTSPRLLLMDEPLSSLDVSLRAEILPYIVRLHEDLGLMVVYVSHSVEEVEAIADRIVILDQGRVIAQGDARLLKDRPELQQRLPRLRRDGGAPA